MAVPAPNGQCPEDPLNDRRRFDTAGQDIR